MDLLHQHPYILLLALMMCMLLLLLLQRGGAGTCQRVGVTYL